MGLSRGVTRSTRAALSRAIGSDGGSGSGGESIPDNAVVDRDGAYILDRDGAYVIADPTPRTS
jgi:hypothetical protein